MNRAGFRMRLVITGKKHFDEEVLNEDQMVRPCSISDHIGRGD
jgi:hypothetical protein